MDVHEIFLQNFLLNYLSLRIFFLISFSLPENRKKIFLQDYSFYFKLLYISEFNKYRMINNI